MPFQIKALGGLDAKIDATGGAWSLGQMQLMCLARAALKTVPVLCLDEATAAMDPHTEAHVLEIIERLFSNRTTFTVAHRCAPLPPPAGGLGSTVLGAWACSARPLQTLGLPFQPATAPVHPPLPCCAWAPWRLLLCIASLGRLWLFVPCPAPVVPLPSPLLPALPPPPLPAGWTP